MTRVFVNFEDSRRGLTYLELPSLPSAGDVIWLYNSSYRVVRVHYHLRQITTGMNKRKWVTTELGISVVKS